MHPLVSVSVMFVCSLTAAFVLFKFVKSTAGVQGDDVGFKIRGFQAGGAIAGFLLTYGLLHYSFTSLSSQQHEEEAAAPSALWTITGKVVKSDGLSPALVKVSPVPPMGAISDNGGNFRMAHVLPIKEDVYPDLVFECESYISQTVTISGENAEIDKENHRIRVSEIVTMAPEGDFFEGLDDMFSDEEISE